MKNPQFMANHAQTLAIQPIQEMVILTKIHYCGFFIISLFQSQSHFFITHPLGNGYGWYDCKVTNQSDFLMTSSVPQLCNISTVFYAYNNRSGLAYVPIYRNSSVNRQQELPSYIHQDGFKVKLRIYYDEYFRWKFYDNSEER